MPAVRPHLPSRYESAAAAAPSVEQVEVDVSATRRAGPELTESVAVVRSRAGFSELPAQVQPPPRTPAVSPAPLPVAETLVEHEVHHHAAFVSPKESRDSAPPRAPVIQATPAAPLAEPLLVERTIVVSPAPAAVDAGHPRESVKIAPAVPVPHVAVAGGDVPAPATPPEILSQEGTGVVRSPVLPAPPLLELPRAEAHPPAPVAPAVPVPEQRVVNITIGRLEIRAATPAQERSRAPQPPGRSPLPLDDFLRGKSPRRRSRDQP